MKEKSTGRFECEINREVSELKWLKSGLEIKGDSKNKLIRDGLKWILEINDCQLEDAGEYVAVVRGRKSTARLNVEGIKIIIC